MNTTLDIIIPVYNESQRLKLTFQALNSFATPRGLKISKVIFVNDGSTDATLEVLESAKIKFPKKIITYTHNQGKGSAIKLGFLNATADYALFMDADMSTPLTELSKLLPYIKEKIPVVIGTRKNGHSTVTVHQPWVREHLGKVFTFLSQLILNTWVTDFTCGFKAPKLILPKTFFVPFPNYFKFVSTILLANTPYPPTHPWPSLLLATKFRIFSTSLIPV